jgi:hypothetical protein
MQSAAISWLVILRSAASAFHCGLMSVKDLELANVSAVVIKFIMIFSLKIDLIV